MLVLGCTSHQSVIIDDVIKVTVLYNKRGQVVHDVSTQEQTAQLDFSIGPAILPAPIEKDPG